MNQTNHIAILVVNDIIKIITQPRLYYDVLQGSTF